VCKVKKKTKKGDILKKRSISIKGYGGVILSADLLENTNAPAAIMLHGGGQTRHSWRTAAEAIAENSFEVINVDLRGHGESEWCEQGNYTLTALKHDLFCVMQELGKPAALIGFSMGGIIALLTASDPKINALCSAVVVVDIGLRPEKKGVDRILEFMHGNPTGFASLEEAAESIAAYQPAQKRPVSVEGLQKNLRLKENGRYYWHWDPRFVARPGDSSKMDEYYSTITRSAANITVPCLMVRGARSDIVSDETVEEFQEFIPHAEYVNVSGASHSVAAERNTAFTQAVLVFLSKNVPSRMVTGLNYGL